MPTFSCRVFLIKKTWILSSKLIHFRHMGTMSDHVLQSYCKAKDFGSDSCGKKNENWLLLHEVLIMSPQQASPSAMVKRPKGQNLLSHPVNRSFQYDQFPLIILKYLPNTVSYPGEATDFFKVLICQNTSTRWDKSKNKPLKSLSSETFFYFVVGKGINPSWFLSGQWFSSLTNLCPCSIVLYDAVTKFLKDT